MRIYDHIFRVALIIQKRTAIDEISNESRTFEIGNILSKKLINHYPNKIINIHPSLLPKYKGLNTHRRVLENNETKTGCTVHYVNQEMDGGEVILQREVDINAEDTESSIARRVLKEEHIIYPEAIKLVLTK